MKNDAANFVSIVRTEFLGIDPSICSHCFKLTAMGILEDICRTGQWPNFPFYSAGLVKENAAE